MEKTDWGEIDYQTSVDRQLDLVVERHNQNIEDILVFCYHPPVVTTGRATTSSDITTWDGDIIEVSRGGRATYHGPNQQVIYPIIYLENKDVHKYLRKLEQTTIKTLKDFAVDSEAKTQELIGDDGKKLELTGVWVGDRKIASIGIAVKKWVTYHGIAINLYKDANAFRGINPCGFKSDIMTSLEEVTGNKISREEFNLKFSENWN